MGNIAQCEKSKAQLDHLRALKRAGRKFSVLTCYDARTAAIMEAEGVDMLLVGDTAAEVVLGLDSTRGIPPEFLLTLTAAVRRGAPNSFVMADLPYAWRHGTIREVTDWTQRFLEETASDAVKIEVTGQDAALIESIRNVGVPVVAHLGLLPQTIEPGETYRARGRTATEAAELLEDARRLENAGASILLLEAVASEVAKEVASRTELPVIGCCSGPYCDGTVVVLHDMIGWGGGHPPKSVKQYADMSHTLGQAFTAYVADIRTGQFPRDEDAIHMKPGEYDPFIALAGKLLNKGL